MVAVLAALGAKGGGGGGGAPPTSAEDLAGRQRHRHRARLAQGQERHRQQPRDRRAEHEQATSNIRTMLKALRSSTSASARWRAPSPSRSASRARCSTRQAEPRHVGLRAASSAVRSPRPRACSTSASTLELGSVGDIIANGISGSTYQIVEKIKKKNGFLGIGGGTKTSYTTTTGALDPRSPAPFRTSS
jgi:hypothetical protein